MEWLKCLEKLYQIVPYYRDFIEMHKKPYDYLIFIGRFQPFHIGHQAVVKKALEHANRVIILVGSSYQPRSVRNPWTFDERKEFICQSFASEVFERLIILPLVDLYNDSKWVKLVETTVAENIIENQNNSNQVKIGLIGHSKDHSSYYLSLFPHWGAVDVSSYSDLSASPLRDHYFTFSEVPNGLSEAVSSIMHQFLQTDAYHYLKSEYEYICEYRKSWELAPYPPTFVTVDAVVVKGGHILLVERKEHPGKGLLALPGGFVDIHERLESALLRELYEETQIELSKETLSSSICAKEVFDSPYRSTRGRTISHAYLLVLENEKESVGVNGDDDAKRAFWCVIDEIDPEKMFEDHAHIIRRMLRMIVDTPSNQTCWSTSL